MELNIFTFLIHSDGFFFRFNSYIIYVILIYKIFRISALITLHRVTIHKNQLEYVTQCITSLSFYKRFMFCLHFCLLRNFETRGESQIDFHTQCAIMTLVGGSVIANDVLKMGNIIDFQSS